MDRPPNDSIQRAWRRWVLYAWHTGLRYETIWLATNLHNAVPCRTVAEVCACWVLAYKVEELQYCELVDLLAATHCTRCSPPSVLHAETTILVMLDFNIVSLSVPACTAPIPPQAMHGLLCFTFLGWRLHLGLSGLSNLPEVLSPILQAALVHSTCRATFGPQVQKAIVV